MLVNSREIIHKEEGLNISNLGRYYLDQKERKYHITLEEDRFKARLLGKPGRPKKGTNNTPAYPLVWVG